MSFSFNLGGVVTRDNKQAVIRREIKMILLASIFLLAPVHSIVIANPLIKINKGAKAHQHHEAHINITLLQKQSLGNLIPNLIIITQTNLIIGIHKPYSCRIKRQNNRKTSDGTSVYYS